MLVLFAAAAYEVAVALLTGIVATLVSRRICRRWPAMLVPVAATAYMLAHYYAFDSYYLPSLRRFSDGGMVPPAWLYVVVVAAVIVAIAIGRRPSTAPALTPLVLLICAVTVLAEGVGH